MESDFPLPHRKPARTYSRQLKRRQTRPLETRSGDVRASSSTSSTSPSVSRTRFTVRRSAISAVKPRSKVRAARSERQLTQLALDLGQSLRTTCSECGMSYYPSDASDVKVHSRFHAKHDGGVGIGTVKLSQIVCQGSSYATNGATSICAIDGRSTPAEKRVTQDVLDLVNCELSAARIPDELLWDRCRFKTYLHIDEKERKCVGLLLAERICKAYTVDCMAADSSSITMAAQSQKAVLGVSRIWTCSSWRRQGVAERLLDAASETFIYGMKVPQNLLAFSQPTGSGALLARSWFSKRSTPECGLHSFLVYVEDQSQ